MMIGIHSSKEASFGTAAFTNAEHCMSMTDRLANPLMAGSVGLCNLTSPIGFRHQSTLSQDAVSDGLDLTVLGRCNSCKYVRY